MSVRLSVCLSVCLSVYLSANIMIGRKDRLKKKCENVLLNDLTNHRNTSQVGDMFRFHFLVYIYNWDRTKSKYFMLDAYTCLIIRN